MDIDVYHCPNCNVVQGPSLSEWLPPPETTRLLSSTSVSNPLVVFRLGGGGVVEGHSAEFSFALVGGWVDLCRPQRPNIKPFTPPLAFFFLCSEKAQQLAQARLHRARRRVQAGAGRHPGVHQGAPEPNICLVRMTGPSTQK